MGLGFGKSRTLFLRAGIPSNVYFPFLLPRLGRSLLMEKEKVK